MKISKRVQSTAKYLNYKLPVKSKPLEMPMYYPEDKTKEAFQSGYYFQVMEKKGVQSWGGGKSGLEDKELKELNKIFQFRYMGYAEYEGGQLGESYRFLKKHKEELVSGQVEVEGKKLYYICLNYHEKFVEPCLKAHVYNAPHCTRLSKEWIHLHRVVAGDEKNFIGAWDTRSHFLFFANRTKFYQFRELINAKAK